MTAAQAGKDPSLFEDLPPKGGSPGMDPPANENESSRIEQLRKKIDNKEYLYGAIQRIAQILSNEILDIPQGGPCNEQGGK
jgi:hypothetical protein